MHSKLCYQRYLLFTGTVDESNTRGTFCPSNENKIHVPYELCQISYGCSYMQISGILPLDFYPVMYPKIGKSLQLKD